jgi:two-component system copper resistance phosphate regulon response regulator CusR/two-component system response regulator QseB
VVHDVRVRVLVVEDHVEIARDIAAGLRDRGIATDLAYDGAAALQKGVVYRYDVIVLDRDLPGVHGDAVCVALRDGGSHARILMLTAAAAIGDRVEGLNLGADDYLPKPFSMEELLARVRSLLRRHTGTKKTLLEHRGLKLDLLTCTVSLNDRPVEMTSREYALLEIFMQNPGRILPRNLICEKIWESQGDADANLLDVYMSRLRSKLESSNDQPFFRTIRGVGYKMQ